MGKNHYLGGGTQVYISDNEKILKKKIYVEIKSELAGNYLSFDRVLNYFEGYGIKELEEVLEDVKINYKSRRNILITSIKSKKIVNMVEEENNIKNQPSISSKNVFLINVESDISFLEKRVEKNPWNNTLKKELKLAIEKKMLLLGHKNKEKQDLAKSKSKRILENKNRKPKLAKIKSESKKVEEERSKTIKRTKKEPKINKNSSMYEALKNSGLL